MNLKEKDITTPGHPESSRGPKICPNCRSISVHFDQFRQEWSCIWRKCNYTTTTVEGDKLPEHYDDQIRPPYLDKI